MLAVPGRRLQFGVDAGVAARAFVQALDQLDHLGERRHGEAAPALGEPVVEAFLRLEPADLVEREVGGVPAAVRPGAAREDLLHVGRRLQVDVVQADEAPVPREHQVGLDVVRPHAVSQGVGRQGVLGQVAAGAAVGDDDGRRRRHGFVVLLAFGGRRLGGDDRRGEERAGCPGKGAAPGRHASRGRRPAVVHLRSVLPVTRCGPGGPSAPSRALPRASRPRRGPRPRPGRR